MKDAPIDNLIREALSAQARESPGPCMNDNVMAAYLEEGLSPEERSAFESHVAGCAACREILAVSLKLRSEEATGLLPDFPAPSRKTLFRFSIPIPALAALLVCIAVGAVVFRWQYRSHESAVKEERVADLRSPAQPPAQTFSQMANDAGEPMAARADADRPEKKAGMAPGENKPTSPPIAQSAQPLQFDKSDSIQASSAAEMPQKIKEESMSPVAAGTMAPPPPQESGQANAPVARRDEMAAIPPASAVSHPMAALPSGAVSGVGGNLQLKEVKGADNASVPKQPADAIVLARTQEPVPRPPLYAASNRIATSMYETESVESSLRFAIKNLGSKLNTAESRKIEDRVFYKNLGYWIDQQCTEHAGNPIVEISSEDPAHGAILKKYPDIRSILPAAIYWEEKNCLLK